MKKELNKKELNKTVGGRSRPIIIIDGTTYTIADCIEATDLRQTHLIKAGIKIEKGMRIATIKPADITTKKKVIRKVI